LKGSRAKNARPKQERQNGERLEHTTDESWEKKVVPPGALRGRKLGRKKLHTGKTEPPRKGETGERYPKGQTVQKRTFPWGKPPSTEERGSIIRPNNTGTRRFEKKTRESKKNTEFVKNFSKGRRTLGSYLNNGRKTVRKK